MSLSPDGYGLAGYYIRMHVYIPIHISININIEIYTNHRNNKQNHKHPTEQSPCTFPNKSNSPVPRLPLSSPRPSTPGARETDTDRDSLIEGSLTIVDCQSGFVCFFLLVSVFCFCLFFFVFFCFGLGHRTRSKKTLGNGNEAALLLAGSFHPRPQWD